jgi:F-type H+-transporting ATPase subunit gamma
MAGGQERVLRRRIRSVQATKKITKAMELIAASQIVRAQSRIAANRPYREGMSRIIVEAAKGDRAAAGKLLGTPEERTSVAVLAIVADRGLCGAYNSSVLRATERLIRELTAEGVQVRLFTAGKKAQSYFRFRGQEIERSFIGFSERPTFADARQVAAAVSAPYVAEEVQQVLLVSTRFRSAGTQVLDTVQLLPLPDPDAGEAQGDDAASATSAPAGTEGYTEFEPDVEKLLSELAPKAMESEVFSALLEAAASEVTARQRAMAAASDNADEVIRTLTRTMNRARQDSITTEIMEIVGGAEALRGSKKGA